MASVKCLHFIIQDVILEKPKAIYMHRLCTLSSTCRPLCNINIHLITLLNILIESSALKHQES